MNNGTTPPTPGATLPGLSDYPTIGGQSELPEGPWTMLVMSFLAGVVVLLCAAQAYAGGV
jgi:hypothetical protein